MKTDRIDFTKLNFYSSFFLGILAISGLTILLVKILPNIDLLLTKGCYHANNFCQQFTPFSNPFISIPYIFLWALGFLVILILLFSLIYHIAATLKFKKTLSSEGK